MPDIFNIVIIQPISWLLLWCYDLVNNYGFAIILFTLITKIILLPLSYKGKLGMMKTSRLQPKVTEIQKKYPSDKQKQQEELAKLYQEMNVNPLSGCLWTLLPFPVLFGLYGVINTPVSNLMKLTPDQIQAVLKIPEITKALGSNTASGQELHLAQIIHENLSAVQAVVPNVKDIDFSFFGLNLSVVPPFALDPLIIIPILAGAAAWFSTMISQKTSNQPTPAGAPGIIMKLMPLMSVYFGFVLPAGLGIYWIASSLFQIVQDYFMSQIVNKKFAEDDAKLEEQKRIKKEAEDEAKREAAKRREENMMQQKMNAGKRPRSAKNSNKQKKAKPVQSSAESGEPVTADDGTVDGESNDTAPSVNLEKANDGAKE